MSVYFTSDLHFGHKNIIKYCNRPWDDVESMNEGLISNWNAVVRPEDTVVVLGDVALGRHEVGLGLVSRLHGIKLLIPGNHDECWSGHKKPNRRKYEDVGFLVSAVETHYNFPLISSDHGYGVEYPVTISHFPFEGDSHGEDRYKQYRPRDNGQWLLHGHVHDAWRIKYQQINVGVDVWNYEPVAEERILAIIES